MTIYVKATGEQLAAWDGFATSSRSGFVTCPEMNANLYFQFVGSNSSDYVRFPQGMPEPTAVVGNVTGCAGLTDAQVQSLYDAKKTY
jgi:hypothetical protein